MVRTKKVVKVGYNDCEGPYYIDKEMTCIDGLGVMQERGNEFYSVTLAEGKQEGRTIGTAVTFYDAADFARTLMQNTPNLYNLIEQDKKLDVVEACRTTQFMLSVHFGVVIQLPFGNFNNNLK